MSDNKDSGDAQKSGLVQHLKKNRSVYIVGASCLIVGATASAIILRRPTVAPEIANLVRQINIASPPVTTIINAVQKPLGHPGTIIKWNEQGTIYMSIAEASRELNLQASHISRHLAGKAKHVNGKTFSVLFDPMADAVGETAKAAVAAAAS